MFLGNSLESDFNLAGIRGPGSGLQKGETPRSEKVPEGEFASESGIERKLAAALRPHGVASGRSEGHGGREETKRGWRGDSRVQEETAPGAFPEQLRP